MCVLIRRAKSTDRMANSVDPDQTAPTGAVLAWSAQFAHTHLSKYLAQIKTTARFHQEN